MQTNYSRTKKSKARARAHTHKVLSENDQYARLALNFKNITKRATAKHMNLLSQYIDVTRVRFYSAKLKRTT